MNFPHPGSQFRTDPTIGKRWIAYLASLAESSCKPKAWNTRDEWSDYADNWRDWRQEHSLSGLRPLMESEAEAVKAHLLSECQQHLRHEDAAIITECDRAVRSARTRYEKEEYGLTDEVRSRVGNTRAALERALGVLERLEIAVKSAQRSRRTIESPANDTLTGTVEGEQAPVSATGVEEGQDEGEGPAKKTVAHGPDFRSVCWYGTNYSFTSTQAACVAVLWEAWENKTPEVWQDTVLEKAGSCTDRLDKLFQGHPAWGTMIVRGTTKGTFRLNPPS